jgi:hypothetical protein
MRMFTPWDIRIQKYLLSPGSVRGAVRAYKVQSIIQHVQKIQTQIKSKAIKDILQPFMDQKNVLLEKRKPPVDTSAGASKKSKTTR